MKKNPSLIKIGLTGSRVGLTTTQERALETYILGLEFDEAIIHHGDCIGADVEAASIIRNLNKFKKVTTVLHPPDVSIYRAWDDADYSEPPKPYLDRNKDIVLSCDILLAFPDGPPILRSGTWSTVRYAYKVEKVVMIFNPGD